MDRTTGHLQTMGNMLLQGRTLDHADIVIIGNGIAGLTAALEARRLSPDKRIVLMTDQVHPTIHTPALKQFMVGKIAREQLLAYPAGTERAERIHVVTTHVEEIHARSKYVTLMGGYGFGYGSLLIATGSAPVGLPENLPGRDFDGVLTLHRLQDYLNLRRRLSEVYEAVVIGSGAHAIETVMGLVHYGVHVHWMIRGETVLSRMLDETASTLILSRMRRAGVSIYTNTQVLGVVGRIGCVAGVITGQQQMIPCQLVLACTGTQAVSTLAQRCTLPLECGRGIKVDNTLRTSVPDIYAAGDVAALQDPLTGQYETRALWYAAVTQGRAVATSMVGSDPNAPQQRFGVSWHATQLGDFSMLTVGNPLLTDAHDTRIELHTDTSGNGYRRLVLLGDRLIGYLSLGQTQPDSLAIKRIIDEGHAVSGIMKGLLKGTFDARSYLSKQQGRAVQTMLTTRRLPALNSPVVTGSERMATRPVAIPSSNAFIHTKRDTTGGLKSVRKQTKQTDPLAPLEPQELTQHMERQEKQETGRRETGPLQQFEEEEIAPFTGKLSTSVHAPADQSASSPRHQQSGVGRIIDSTLIPVVPVQAHRTRSGKLWSYMPAEQSVQQQQQKQKADKPDNHSGKQGLWAYSDYEDRSGR